MPRPHVNRGGAECGNLIPEPPARVRHIDHDTRHQQHNTDPEQNVQCEHKSQNEKDNAKDNQRNSPQPK